MAFEDPGTFECNRRSGDLRAGWRAEAEAQGFDAAAFRGVFGRSAPTVATAEADERLAEELSSPTGLTRRASTFDRRAVLQALCEHLPTGGAFAGLARRLGAHTLRANRRQAEAWERAALASLRAGRSLTRSMPTSPTTGWSPHRPRTRPGRCSSPIGGPPA